MDAPHDLASRTVALIQEKQPNGKIVHSTKVCRLELATLHKGAREAHILPGLEHSFLVSIGKLCDAGCKASFNRNTMPVTKDEQVMLQCTRDLMAGLCRVPLQILYRPTHQSNHLHQFNGKENAMEYLHAEAFSPVQDTWSKYINRGYFNTWPGLTAKDMKKMTKYEATIKGHLSQSRKIPVVNNQQEQQRRIGTLISSTKTR